MATTASHTIQMRCVCAEEYPAAAKYENPGGAVVQLKALCNFNANYGKNQADPHHHSAQKATDQPLAIQFNNNTSNITQCLCAV